MNKAAIETPGANPLAPIPEVRVNDERFSSIARSPIDVPAAVGAGVLGLHGAVSGYRNARRKQRGVLSSTANGLVRGGLQGAAGWFGTQALRRGIGRVVTNTVMPFGYTDPWAEWRGLKKKPFPEAAKALASAVWNDKPLYGLSASPERVALWDAAWGRDTRRGNGLFLQDPADSRRLWVNPALEAGQGFTNKVVNTARSIPAGKASTRDWFPVVANATVRKTQDGMAAMDDWWDFSTHPGAKGEERAQLRDLATLFLRPKMVSVRAPMEKQQSFKQAELPAWVEKWFSSVQVPNTRIPVAGAGTNAPAQLFQHWKTQHPVKATVAGGFAEEALKGMSSVYRQFSPADKRIADALAAGAFNGKLGKTVSMSDVSTNIGDQLLQNRVITPRGYNAAVDMDWPGAIAAYRSKTNRPPVAVPRPTLKPAPKATPPTMAKKGEAVPTAKTIATRKQVPVASVVQQLAAGTKEEAEEHRLPTETARQVATDHVKKIPDYYSRLERMESKAAAEFVLGMDKWANEAPPKDDLGGLPGQLGAETNADYMLRLADIRADVAKAAETTNTGATPAQKKAGNYKKGRANIDGLTFVIENPAGSIRSGTSASGKRWSVTMKNHYGYFSKSEGTDGDEVDVFVNQEHPLTGKVFVVNQNNPSTGKFDEHKVMVGWTTPEAAKQAYLDNFSEGWTGFDSITPMTWKEFKVWVNSDKPKNSTPAHMAGSRMAKIALLRAAADPDTANALSFVTACQIDSAGRGAVESPPN